MGTRVEGRRRRGGFPRGNLRRCGQVEECKGRAGALVPQGCLYSAIWEGLHCYGSIEHGELVL